MRLYRGGGKSQFKRKGSKDGWLPGITYPEKKKKAAFLRACAGWGERNSLGGLSGRAIREVKLYPSSAVFRGKKRGLRGEFSFERARSGSTRRGPDSKGKRAASIELFRGKKAVSNIQGGKSFPYFWKTES